MDTMEITKFAGALFGSLLVFLVVQAAADLLYDTHAEEVAYLIETPEDAPAEDAAEAEEAETVDVAALMAEADPADGEGVFRRCSSCHKVDGSNGVGPHLDGVVGRDIASVEGFGYSDDLAALDGDWTPEAINQFIENPKSVAAGTSMSFAGLSKQQDRIDLIAYLNSLSN